MNRRRKAMFLSARIRKRSKKLAKERYGRPYGNLCPRRQTAISRLASREEREAGEKAKEKRKSGWSRFIENFNAVFSNR
jgi:hypothetical protein